LCSTKKFDNKIRQGIIHEYYLLHLYELFTDFCPAGPKTQTSMLNKITGKEYSGNANSCQAEFYQGSLEHLEKHLSVWNTYVFHNRKWGPGGVENVAVMSAGSKQIILFYDLIVVILGLVRGNISLRT
jgi:hypothetical protein